jgi:glycosyltransferase involved in cell wall biosynthesis
LERFAPSSEVTTVHEELGIPSDAKIILTVCRLAPAKNVSHLIRAFSLLQSTDTYLVIVGDGPRRARLESLAQQLGAADRVRFVGWQSDTVRFYQSADVFVLPSTYEPFGQVLLEAMACGVPCIGLKSNYPEVITASEELIRDGVTGYHISPSSVDDLTLAIQRFTSDPVLRQEMGAKAREMCAREYSWSRCIRELLAFDSSAIPEQESIVHKARNF